MAYQDGSNGNGNKVEKLASNAFFTVAGRFAMLLAVPILIWMANSLVGLQIQVSVMKASFDAATIDHYRGSDAARDLKATQLQIDDAKRRIEVLERQVPGSARR